MPLYSDPGYYYGSSSGGGYQSSYSPYYTAGLYGTTSTSSASPYAPYSSIYNRSYTGNYVAPPPPVRSSPFSSTSRYKPKLGTISESPLSPRNFIPLTRTQSPKFSTYSHSLPSKYIPPRPIVINTADIDVSSSRYRKHEHTNYNRTTNETRIKDKAVEEVSVADQNNNRNDESNAQDEAKPHVNRSTIKRDRAVVRLSTVRSRSKDRNKKGEEPSDKKQKTTAKPSEKPAEEKSVKVSWRQKFGDDLSLKTPNVARKTPGELLRERYFIHDNKEDDDVIRLPIDIMQLAQPQYAAGAAPRVVEPLVQTALRRLSISKCPSFHEICEDISSDKIDDDLNAGELRRRASIIHEQEMEIISQLQKSASGAFPLFHLERSDSQGDSRKSTKRDSRKSTKSKRGSKKIRHKITATVDVENPPLTPIIQVIQEIAEEEVLTPTKLSYKVEEVEEHKVFKLPKKKAKVAEGKNQEVKDDAEKPQERTSKKIKTVQRTSSKSKKSEVAAKTATVVDETTVQDTKLERKISPETSSKPGKEPTVKSPTATKDSPKPSAIAAVQKSEPKSPKSPLKTTTGAKKANASGNIFTFDPIPSTPETPSTPMSPKQKKSTEEAPIAKPKPIAKLQKSDSGEDFWSQIGTRETIYMSKRKQNLIEEQWNKRETLLEDQAIEEVKNLQEIKTKVTSQKIEELKQSESSVAYTRALSNDSALHDKAKQVQKEARKISESSDAEPKKTSPKKVKTTSPKKSSGKKPSVKKTSPKNVVTSAETAAIPVVTSSQSITTIVATPDPKVSATQELQQQINNIQKPKENSGQTAKSPETKTNNNKENVHTNLRNKIAIGSNNQATAAAEVTTTTPTTTTTTKITSVAEESSKSANNSTIQSKLIVQQKKETETKEQTSLATNVTKNVGVANTASKETAKTSVIVADLKKSTVDGKSGASPKADITQNAQTRSSNETTASNEKILSKPEQGVKISGAVSANNEIKTKTTTTETKPETPATATASVDIDSDDELITKLNRPKAIGKFQDNDVLNAPVRDTTNKSSSSALTEAAAANSDATIILSKFPTVSNLALCLQDVDADLEDYIPSSAEDTDSSYETSSESGRENLTDSMKKKNKHRKKKEKAEQKFNPNKVIKIDPKKKCYVKEEAPPYPLVATPRPLWKREKFTFEESESESEETESESECTTTSDEYEDELNPSKDTIIRMSTCSNDSGFEGGTAPPSPKKMLETSYTYAQFQKSGRITAPATTIPRFKKYSVEDFHFLAVLGKGSFGKVLLAELRNTDYYYAVKCLKKDVVLEDDDVECTLIERKVLALGTKHPYLCHLFCTFQTESHLFFVMEYLNGGDLMFHIQESGRFPENRARFYGAEIISGLKFLHKKGIIYRDLKLDNVLLDFDGHVRIADFGMCKLQIYLDKTADSFCGTPDYMAPEIIKAEKYNQNVDWWSFGVLMYEMLIGQSPFSGCDEDELFWSICNEIPWFPVYVTQEATSLLKGLLQKDATKRIGSQYSPAGDICDHTFFRSIDWELLEKRQLEPPFKPQVKHPLDTQYFDKAFTRERVRLTPIDKEILQSMDQEQFQGFSYTNPNATLD